MKRYSKYLNEKQKQKNQDILHFSNMDYSVEFRENQSQKIILDQNTLAKQGNYRSIKAEKINNFKDQQDLNKSQDDEDVISTRKIQKKPSEIKISNSNSRQKFKLNNFFGSKKQIERPKQTYVPSVNLANPQQTETNNQVQEKDDHNNTLAILVQKQIQQKKVWQAKKNLEESSINGNLISDNSSFHKNSSGNLLKKLNEEMFISKNIKRHMFQDKQDQNLQYIIENNQQNQLDNSVKKKRIKTKLPSLSPLKTRPTSEQVLKNLEFLKKKQIIQKKEQIIEPVAIIQKKQKTQNKIQNNFLYSRQLNLKQVNKNSFISGCIKRNKQGLCNNLFPIYNFIADDQSYIVSARKTMTGYIICADQQELSQLSPNFLGQIKGNLVGSVYNLYQSNKNNEILATYVYVSEFSTSSQVREIQIYVKDKNIEYKDLEREDLSDLSSNLQELYSQGENMIEKKIIKYINKKPTFCEITKRFFLNLGLKTVIPSVKNSVIINPDSPQENVLTLAKIGNHRFSFKVGYPFNVLTAMGYLMTSFNFKFLTQ